MLILFVYEQVNNVLTRSFVSNNLDCMRSEFGLKSDQSMGNFVCYVAESYVDHIKHMKTSDDHWLRANTIFIWMAKDFFTFVDSYCYRGVIGIETGYKRFVAVSVFGGHTCYSERHW